MVKIGTSIIILDNSGAKSVKCFSLKKKKNNKSSEGFLGDIIKGSVKKFIPERKVSKKDKLDVLIILHKKKQNYRNGLYQKNECIGGIVLKDNLSIFLYFLMTSL